jgi:hypothetical protein
MSQLSNSRSGPFTYAGATTYSSVGTIYATAKMAQLNIGNGVMRIAFSGAGYFVFDDDGSTPPGTGGSEWYIPAAGVYFIGFGTDSGSDVAKYMYFRSASGTIEVNAGRVY